MKLFNKLPHLLSITAIATASLITGCSKQLDINQNPNNPVETNIEPYIMLPGAMSNSASNIATGYTSLYRYLGFVATAAGVAPSAEEESYNISTSFLTGAFTTPFDINYDLQYMQEKAALKGQTFYVGAARIFKSLNFARIVDAYNSIPYSQSLQGLKFITPKYDDPKTIYESLLSEIDSGIAIIKAYDINANPNVKIADIMWGSLISGSATAAHKTAWVKFANTLKLRLLMHQANRSDRQDYIKAEIAKIIAEGSGFLESTKSANVNPGYSQAQPNPYYSSFGFTIAGQDPGSTRANNNLMNMLKVDADPRVGAIYKPVATALPANAAEPTPTLAPKNYRGNDYGLAIDNAVHKYQTANYVSRVGGTTANGLSAGPVSASSTGILKGWDMPAWVITSIESLFLQAEAAQRGYISTIAPENAYKNAVQESFIWLNVGGGTADTAKKAFNTWYNGSMGQSYQSDVYWPSNTDKLKLIAYQKYLALSSIEPMETWTDYRRNGAYPVIQLSQNTARSSPILPVRLLYPSTEINNNGSNVPAIGRQAGSQFTDKIWWMP